MAHSPTISVTRIKTSFERFGHDSCVYEYKFITPLVRDYILLITSCFGNFQIKANSIIYALVSSLLHLVRSFIMSYTCLEVVEAVLL